MPLRVGLPDDSSCLQASALVCAELGLALPLLQQQLPALQLLPWSPTDLLRLQAEKLQLTACLSQLMQLSGQH
jgi:hypothetical protein